MFASTFFHKVSVVVLLTTANALAAATPAVASTVPANSTAPDSGSDAQLQFADGQYKINFGMNNVLHAVIGNSNNVVTALSPNVVPSAVWDIRRGEHSFFLSVGGKNAVQGGGAETIPFSDDRGSGWVITKPFDRPAGPNEWIILNNIQRPIFPAPETGWKVPKDLRGPLTNTNGASIFTFVRVGN